MNKFQLQSKFKPTGDQPQAIKKLLSGLKKNMAHQTLLGVTGSGKTFTMANVINEIQKPTLIISPNKTLAAQLYGEFRHFFPENAVHYFVSYYDYYQPEAYIPQSDTYIEKESQINDEIDRLRHAATQAVLTRNDVIIVASVSCIYGLGQPEAYKAVALNLFVGQKIKRQELLAKLIDLHYDRNDHHFGRGTFMVKGEIIEIHPVTGDQVITIEFFGNEITSIKMLQTNQPLAERTERRKDFEQLSDVQIFPAKHYVIEEAQQKDAIENIRQEAKAQLKILKKQNKLLEAQRLEQRVKYDLEMIKEIGYCNGIENYSRHFDNRDPGQPPYVLLDFFPKDFLTIIDESHIAIPQIRGMYAGDQARKKTLIDHGFRLPSALDNRPLNFKEFSEKMHRLVYTSATPASHELEKSEQIVEQLIRPTGLLDPKIEVRKTDEQIADLINEITKRVKKKQRVLVTTLTKAMSEELTDYLLEQNIKVQYLHSGVHTIERVDILRDLRKGKYDCLVGINLLREGLDLPEVSLVAILDADKQGFLRNETTLIQTMGRAARHSQGQIIMYADKMTDSMKIAIQETNRRRKVQEAYNKKHGIKPKTIKRDLQESILD